MQMSQMGPLPSILFQIVKEHSVLIPRIFPERREAYSLSSYDHSKWTEPELRHAFRLLANEDPSEAKFCFFIDSLDEFGGDHTNLTDLPKDIGSSPHIKVYVSSRP